MLCYNERQQWNQDGCAKKRVIGITNSTMDRVKNPSHYNSGDIECIDAIKAALGTEGFLEYCTGNCIKYLWRWRYKNGIEDLKKTQEYLGFMLKTMEEE